MLKYLVYSILIIASPGFILQDNLDIITDCNYTLEEALEGIDIPLSIKNKLVILDVEYYSFDGNLHKGQLVIHKDLKNDISEIFSHIKENKFPIAKMIPVVRYHWSDEGSMQDNNTSAFNYRKVKGTKVLSAHSTGRAIDINPKINPQITNGISSPPGSNYNPRIEGTITVNSFIVKEFRTRGWKWGGAWKSTKDYQHFEKK